MTALADSPGALRAAAKPPHRGLTLAVAGVATLALLWLCFTLITAGQALVAVGLLAIGLLAISIYASATSLAWKYLFPGITGMLVFAAFPLVYTMQIGFTNYSSSHLLTEERSRQYLLEQTEVDEASLRAFALYRQGERYRLVLVGEGDTRLLSPALDLRAAAPAAGGAQEAAAGLQAVTLAGGALPAGEALAMRDVIALRSSLMALKLRLPAAGGAAAGATLSYASLREFGVIKPVWRPEADGALTQLASGKLYKPNREQGWFEAGPGEAIQPGFKVGVGFANYARMLLDPDFRGPFVSIFIWTVVFAGLTVVFSTAIGMTLAVLLNWERLAYRTLYRTLLFLPYAVPGFISILVFKGLFNQNFGEINAILNAVFGIRPSWFADPTLAKAMILIVNTWLGYPYVMVICTGLIKAIPADLYEASALAGAKPLTNFFRITAPLIAKPLTPLLISAFAFNFNNFVLISLLTDGRPDYLNTKLPAGTTDILVSYTYRIAFTDSGQNFGLAAAISTLIFVMVAMMSIVQLKAMNKAEAKR